MRRRTTSGVSSGRVQKNGKQQLLTNANAPPPEKKVKKQQSRRTRVRNSRVTQSLPGQNGKIPKKSDHADGSRKQFQFSEHPTIEELRQKQCEFVMERNWDQYHSPRNLLLAMVGEVGELAELFQWRGEVEQGLPDWTNKERGDLENEMADVFIYLIRLAEKCRVDLPTAAIAKMALNSAKYPVSKVFGSSKKYTEYK